MRCSSCGRAVERVALPSMSSSTQFLDNLFVLALLLVALLLALTLQHYKVRRPRAWCEPAMLRHCSHTPCALHDARRQVQILHDSGAAILLGALVGVITRSAEGDESHLSEVVKFKPEVTANGPARVHCQCPFCLAACASHLAVRPAKRSPRLGATHRGAWLRYSSCISCHQLFSRVALASSQRAFFPSPLALSLLLKGRVNYGCLCS